MQQLNEHDAGFWATDSASSNANLTLLHIYDQSTAPCGRVRFKDILAHIESRLDRLPRFRQKLLRVPLELDFPYWVDDQEFSLMSEELNGRRHSAQNPDTLAESSPGRRLQRLSHPAEYASIVGASPERPGHPRQWQRQPLPP